MKTKKKSLVLALVEGTTDNKTLILPMRRLLPQLQIEPLFTDGDLCLRDDATFDSVYRDIADSIRSFYAQNSVWRGQDAEVIHIVDLDEAFHPQASTRLKNKAQILSQLAQIHSIVLDETLDYKIPYTVYYMSRHLEHVIHGEPGPLSSAAKDELAMKFQRLASKDASILLDLLKKSAAPGQTTWDTWQYVIRDEQVNALSPLNNLAMFFARYTVKNQS